MNWSSLLLQVRRFCSGDKFYVSHAKHGQLSFCSTDLAAAAKIKYWTGEKIKAQTPNFQLMLKKTKHSF